MKPAMILFLILTCVLTASGQRASMPHRIEDKLKLTDQQKHEVDRIREDAVRKGIDRRAEMARARLDLRQLFQAEEPDQAMIEKKLGEIASLETGARTDRVQTWFAINKQLTAEQQKIWKKGLLRRMDIDKRMGHRGGTMRRHADRHRRR